MLGSSATNITTPHHQHAAEFDGVNDVVSIGALNSGPGNMGTGDYSIAFWLKNSDAFSNPGMETITGIKPDTNNFNRFWVTNSSNYLSYTVRISGSYIIQLADDDNWATTYGEGASAKWVHVAATIDRSGNAILYINGTAKDTEDISSDSSTNFNMNATWNISGVGGSYDGFSMFDFAVWDKALSAAEVAQIAKDKGHFSLMYNKGDYVSAGDVKYHNKLGNDSVRDFHGEGGSTTYATPTTSGALQILPEGHVTPIKSTNLVADASASEWDVGGNNTIVDTGGAGGEVKITYVDNAAGASLQLKGESGVLSETVVGSTPYMLGFEVKCNKAITIHGNLTRQFNYLALDQWRNIFVEGGLIVNLGSGVTGLINMGSLSSGAEVFIRNVRWHKIGENGSFWSGYYNANVSVTDI